MRSLLSADSPVWFTLVAIGAITMWVSALARLRSDPTYVIDAVLLSAVAVLFFARWRRARLVKPR